MQPLALVLNIAIVVGIIGIVAYWVRRFAVFLGYKSIQPDVLQIALLLKTQPLRDGSDIVVAGHYNEFVTIVRFSHKVDTPGLDIQMRVPATINVFLTPKTFTAAGEGRALVRTGSASLDRRFNARTDHSMEFKMLTAGSALLASLEQLCCSTQTGFSIKGRVMELSELTIPPFTANHVFDHLQSMITVANGISEMPGASQIKVEPLPRQGSSWPIRIALAGGLACLVGLLFAQPYGRASGTNHPGTPAVTSGIAPADAARLQQLQGWRVIKADDFSPAALRFFREHRVQPRGQIKADFTGRGGAADSAYLLVDTNGRKRVSMLAVGSVAYDAIFSRVDLIARVPKNSATKIQWLTSAPQFVPEGDALLVIQNANDPTSGVVLLRHGTETYSARPADFTRIDLASE